MKKALKLLAFILIISILTLTFSGCELIDEMRKSQAFLINPTTIEYNGETYTLLPHCDYLNPQDGIDSDIYVTDPDVPVLLSDILGDTAYLSKDGSIISCFTSYTEHYCRSDEYEKTVELINNGFENTGYCYNYYDYINQLENYYCFTEQENSAMNEVLSTVEETVLPKEIAVNYEYIADLEIYSHNLNFRKDTADLCFSGDKYYILNYKGEDTVIQNVPPEYNDIFKSIMSKLIKNEDTYSETISDDFFLE